MTYIGQCKENSEKKEKLFVAYFGSSKCEFKTSTSMLRPFIVIGLDCFFSTV